MFWASLAEAQAAAGPEDVEADAVLAHEDWLAQVTGQRSS
jgi:hypothetical protein